MSAASSSLTGLDRALGQAAILVVAGLLVQAVTLFWNHPLSFLSFALVGGTAIVLGVARYLFAVMTYSEAPGAGMTAPETTVPEEPAAE